MLSTDLETQMESTATTEMTGDPDRFPSAGLIERVDLFRSEATRSLDPTRRAEMGQFLTPPSIARFMASLFSDPTGPIRLLDAGAGIGTLTAAFVEDACNRRAKANQIEAVAYELDPLLASYLGTTLSVCRELCAEHDIRLNTEVRQADFVVEGVAALRKDLFAPQFKAYNRAILNPPYRKIRSESEYRTLLRQIGIETSNLYAAFLALVIELLEPDGELVAITPRSFCNGPYFRPFRKQLLEKMAIRRVHVFESRGAAFSDDEVLQENIIFHAVKNVTRGKVILSRAQGPNDDTLTVRDAPYEEVVHPDDTDRVIRIPTTDVEAFVKDRMGAFEHTLEALGLEVSTGRVVDFRARDMLRSAPAEDTVPLIYPGHFDHGGVRWPDPKNRKPQAILESPTTRPLFLPSGSYVLVKRFTSKEERRRVVAAVFDGDRAPSQHVAFENHLNVFHIGGAGLPSDLARGLALFLNSTLLDVYFRQFSGHTQVNATDLRALRYPSRQALERLGRQAGNTSPPQRDIDRLVEEEVLRMTDIQSPNPIAAKEKISEAGQILKALGLPRGQLNDRSALTLLALVGLRPERLWAQASNPRIGITPIMDFCRDHYGTRYAPNTRESFRKQTMHQFVEACVAVANPDQPDRPTNSPKWCYQVEARTLRLLRAFGTAEWEPKLSEWRLSVESLKQRYRREREMHKVPVSVAEGTELYLTPGNHSRLIRAVVEEFAQRFTPGGRLLYVGDTGEKWAHFDPVYLGALGVNVDEHGKMPDVVIYYEAKHWLVLVEAVTSVGPVDPKRRDELGRLFQGARPGLVFVTAFLNRSDMARHFGEISWATDVWVADSESHLIHFDGERFLGPYSE